MDNELSSLTAIFTEFYYWVTIPLMFLIHVGFCMYDVGVSRRKNHMHTLMKNTMLVPLVTITFFFFGWWIYWAFPNGPWINGGILWGDGAANTPWANTMGPHLGDRITGVFWAAFLLFSWTAASMRTGCSLRSTTRSVTSATGTGTPTCTCTNPSVGSSRPRRSSSTFGLIPRSLWGAYGDEDGDQNRRSPWTT